MITMKTKIFAESFRHGPLKTSVRGLVSGGFNVTRAVITRLMEAKMKMLPRDFEIVRNVPDE